MAITTQDGLIAALAAGRTVNFFKPSQGAATGATITLFRIGGVPGAGSIPSAGSGRTLSRTSAGAMQIPAPSGTSYITSFTALSSQASTFILADRLVETAGLSGIVTTEQGINSVDVPARATTANDVELWLEIYSALGGTTVATVTASYTNQAGVAGQTATLVGGIPASGGTLNRGYQFTLQAGDTSVRSVQSVTLGSSTGTAGNFGIVLRRTMLYGSVVAPNLSFTQGYAETDLQILADDACVELLVQPTTPNTGNVQGNFGVAQG